jgi:hypothetical protein
MGENNMSEKLRLSEVLSNISAELLKAEESAKKSGSSIMQFDEGGRSRKDSNVVRVKFKSLATRPLQVPQEAGTEGPALKKQT